MAEQGRGPSADDVRAALEAAAKETMRPGESPFAGPGVFAVEVTHDVRLGELTVVEQDGAREPIGLWPGVTLRAGVYYVMRDGTEDDGTPRLMADGGGDGTAVLYAFSLDQEAMDRIAEFVQRTRDADGAELPEGERSVEMSGHFKPMEAKNGKRLTINDVAAWAACNRAQDAGDRGLAQAVIEATYARYAKPHKQAPGLPKQDANPVRNYYQLLSKTSNDGVLSASENNGKTIRIGVGGPEERPVYTYLSLTYDSSDVKLSRPISPFDMSVHNAVCSLWDAGDRYITDRQIWQLMTGKESAAEASLQAVRESMEWLMRTWATIDFSAELRGEQKVLDGEPFTPEQAKRAGNLLLGFNDTVVATNGKRVDGYKLSDDMPILLQHDRVLNQVQPYDPALLGAVFQGLSSTRMNIVIRDYLMRRVSRIGNTRSPSSRRIKYDTLLERIGRKDAKAKDRDRIINSVKKILEALKAQGLIAGWSEYRNGGRSHKRLGVEVALPKKKAKSK